ncbi:glutamine amidotransferase-related protein [Mycoplasma sp. SG1]|uniref:glutamine amidotransferase-related protein n=1 Tax=Mycoplasma sp. SG1 TaxID=2810348 RepID=UPI002AFFFB2A|nr:hypothetical protein [Mycoplasma sp. SG1]
MLSWQKKNLDLVEIFELKNYKFFVSCQFHPEFTSYPNKPNRLILNFIKAAVS